jgi:lipopolysaccharide/colanic/teichoic acid biosynthesis glycosyltransferase
MRQHLWQYLGVRIITGWLIVTTIPALILFWSYILEDNILITQVNSVVASSITIMLTLIWLDRLTQFPGQRSMVTVLPTLLASGLLAGLVLFFFRLPYSIYYLMFSAVVGVLFCFVSQIALRAVTRITIGYVPIGRYKSLLTIKNVYWTELSKCYQIEHLRDLPFNAVVADLSDDGLCIEWERLLAEIALQGTPVYNVLQVSESLTGRLPIKHIYENNLGALLPSQSYLSIKRVLDTAFIVMSALLVVPIVLVVALIIKWESRHDNSDIIFTQQRIGQGGKLFTMYKFRSMIASSEVAGAQMASKDDMRVTKFGSFIRKTRLDELPQFINVLKGDMSLIGPRPEQLSFVRQFNDTIPFYRYRHIVKPGISGWAQVMHGYVSDEDETKVKLEHDFFYIKNFSLTLDLLIVIKTIQTMITGFGAR